jgi:hypothetical protein
MSPITHHVTKRSELQYHALSLLIGLSFPLLVIPYSHADDHITLRFDIDFHFSTRLFSVLKAGS